MEEMLGKMAGRFKVSITDSTMMWILHSAMNKAHERVQSKEGAIERLNEITKFYELAMMQLEGCLKVVHEEAESGLESSDEEVLGELTEIRDRLEGRLRESELAISQKDRELRERLENELKLRQSLLRKERELDSLRNILELERTKTEGIEELVLGNRVSVDEDRDGEFSDLKSSVDQQVWNIKQKLEFECRFPDEKRSHSFDEMKIEQMSSDIDVLKETMDITFGKIQSAIFLSEFEPIEQQCMWTIERDAIIILIRGFMKDIQETFNEKIKTQKKQASIDLSNQLSELLRDIACLDEQLEPLSTSSSNVGSKVTLKTEGRSLSEEDINCKHFDHNPSVQQLGTEDPEEDGGHSVAKMIKNHESIIRKQNEEPSWLKREIFKEKGCPSSRTEKEHSNLRRRIQDFIVTVQTIINWNSKLGESSGHYEGDDSEETSSTKRLFNPNVTEQAQSQIETSEDVWEMLNKVPISHTAYEELQNEISMLRKESDDANVHIMIMEETYISLLGGFYLQSQEEWHDHHLEGLIGESIHEVILKKMVREWNEEMEIDKIELQIKQDIYCLVLSESMKEFNSLFDSAIIECQFMGSKENSLRDHNLERKLMVEICNSYLGEMCKEWNVISEQYDARSPAWEEVNRIASEEIISDKVGSDNEMVNELKKLKITGNSIYGIPLSNESCQCIEYSIIQDIHMVFLEELPKDWKKEIDAYNYEIFMTEEIILLTVVEAMKEARMVYEEAESGRRTGTSKYNNSAGRTNRSLEVSGEENLVQKQDPTVNFKVHNSLVQNAWSEINEYNNQLDIFELKHEELYKLKISRELLTEIDSFSCSVSSNVVKALEEVAVSKTLLSQLRSCLGMAVEDIASLKVQTIPTVTSLDDTERPCLQPKENEILKSTAVDLLSTHIMEVSEAFMKCKYKAEEKLDLNILRLEEAIRCLNAQADLVASVKRKEWLYKKAFIRRCENLRKAEIEVDLLGDRVDALSSLLESIYLALYHHSPVLQQYFEVSLILEMIEKELCGNVLSSSY